MGYLLPYQILYPLVPRRSHWSCSWPSHTVTMFALVLAAVQTNPLQVYSPFYDKHCKAYQFLLRLETFDFQNVKVTMLKILRFSQEVGLLGNADNLAPPTYMP